MILNAIKEKISDNKFLLTGHAIIESARDRIDDADIKHAILGGEIIESYPDDVRGVSVLVSGTTRGGRPLHVVIGVASEEPVIITVYTPEPPKWITPHKRGKREP